MNKEEAEAVASNKAVRSKRKKMNRFLSHLFAGRFAIKKKKKMNKEETEGVAVRTSNK
ncbi:hypothetical protein A2U01_0056335, partial [Trifolium medium]|nr:hypothetical protein [Trifolium medium]